MPWKFKINCFFSQVKYISNTHYQHYFSRKENCIHTKFKSPMATLILCDISNKVCILLFLIFLILYAHQISITLEIVK